MGLHEGYGDSFSADLYVSGNKSTMEKMMSSRSRGLEEMFFNIFAFRIFLFPKLVVSLT
jgi:hypothetical protein